MLDHSLDWWLNHLDLFERQGSQMTHTDANAFARNALRSLDAGDLRRLAEWCGYSGSDLEPAIPGYWAGLVAQHLCWLCDASRVRSLDLKGVIL